MGRTGSRLDNAAAESTFSTSSTRCARAAISRREGGPGPTIRELDRRVLQPRSPSQPCQDDVAHRLRERLPVGGRGRMTNPPRFGGKPKLIHHLNRAPGAPPRARPVPPEVVTNAVGVLGQRATRNSATAAAAFSGRRASVRSAHGATSRVRSQCFESWPSKREPTRPPHRRRKQPQSAP